MGASVTARNPETGFIYTAVTNDEGLYRILYVNPGSYEIAYEARGFSKVIRHNILVRSTETARVDLMLEVGGVVESVDVKAVGPLLESETSMVGHLVTGETINKLPAPQQNTQTVLFYMPGVTSQNGIGHVAGQRSRSFVATMDGVSGMEPVRGEIATGRILLGVMENVGEIKVLTTALPAEYGHSGGGVMNIEYKSGTNKLHGLGEERYRYPAATHRLWEDATPITGLTSFHLISGTLSGPVVLPKIYNGRDKTFFLFGFHRHHERSSENNDRDVPSAAMYAGDFSFGGVGNPIYDPATLVQLPNGSYSRTVFPGNKIPQTRFDPAVQKFLSFNPWTPENNRHNQEFINTTGPHNDLSADTRFSSFRTAFNYKIDHSFSDRHKIFGRLSEYRHRAFIDRWQVAVANHNFDYNFTPNPVDQRQLAISDSFTINPTTVNEIRFGANRRLFKIIPSSINQDWAAKLGIPNVAPDTMPSFLNSTGGQLYSRFPEGRQIDVTENFSLQENLTMVRGHHTFKTGYEILRTRANSLPNATPSGQYRFGGTESPFTPNTGNDFASFLLGSVVRADYTQTLATWLPRWWDHSLYFQDDWKVSSTLTFNLGLRWQYESPFNTKYSQQSQFSPDAIDPLTGLKGALLHPTGPLAQRYFNNFQPRVGLADNFAKNWVFRAGFAVNTLDLWTVGLQENFDEYLATTTVQRPPGDPGVAFYLSQGPPPITFNVLQNGTSPFVGTNFSGRNASYYDPKMRLPYVMNWNAGFQRQLGSSMLVEVTYQGSGGVGLLERWDINAIPLDIATSFADLDRIRRAAQNYKPYPQFGSIYSYSNYGHNTFHSGTLKIEKRISHGLEFTSFYTRSKAIDEASTDGAASGVTFYNRRLEKGRSSYDVTNSWVTYMTYALPFGRGRRFLGHQRGAVNALLGSWNLYLVQTIQNGTPITFTFAGSSNVYLPGVSRPDMAPGKTYDDIRIAWDSHGPCRFNVSCALPWANINAFAYPSSFAAGQAGRNIVNGPGMLWHELSAAKEFPIRERLRASVRLDVNNPFKRYFFAAPNSVVDFRNPQAFGKITGTQGLTSGIGASKFFMEMIFRLEF
jgi:hypothetical protein